LLATADEPEHNEEWLVELRHGGSYKKGREEIIALSRESHGLPVGKKPE
jgi:hypothetical protein